MTPSPHSGTAYLVGLRTHKHPLSHLNRGPHLPHHVDDVKLLGRGNGPGSGPQLSPLMSASRQFFQKKCSNGCRAQPWRKEKPQDPEALEGSGVPEKSPLASGSPLLRVTSISCKSLLHGIQSFPFFPLCCHSVCAQGGGVHGRGY